MVPGDGAPGALLPQRSQPLNGCCDGLNPCQPEVIYNLHREYPGSGALLAVS